MVPRSRTCVRTGLVALAVTLGAALVSPAAVSAAPALSGLSGLGDLSAPALSAPALSAIPGDAELTEALRTVKSTGADAALVEVLTTILNAQGSPDLGALPIGNTAPAISIDPSTVSATPVDDPIATAVTGLEAFEKLTGATVLTPAFAPFCAATSPDNPLGLVQAPAAALPGPFPKLRGQATGEALGQIVNGLGIPMLDRALANNREITEISAALTGSAPLRLARVDTDQGSILTAVLGTTSHAGRTCHFLPAVGIVETPAK